METLNREETRVLRAWLKIRGPFPGRRPRVDHRVSGLQQDGRVRARRSAQAHRTTRRAPEHSCRAGDTPGGS